MSAENIDNPISYEILEDLEDDFEEVELELRKSPRASICHTPEQIWILPVHSFFHFTLVKSGEIEAERLLLLTCTLLLLQSQRQDTRRDPTRRVLFPAANGIRRRVNS